MVHEADLEAEVVDLDLAQDHQSDQDRKLYLLFSEIHQFSFRRSPKRSRDSRSRSRGRDRSGSRDRSRS